MAMLEVNHLSIQFGGLRAVDGFNMTIEKGQLYGLIGPNGAGKTTVFNLLTGVYKPTEGIIRLDGEDITGKSTIEINKAGIARTFQNIRLSPHMSVLENVMVGCHVRRRCPWWMAPLGLPTYYKEEKAITDKARDLVEHLNLAEYMDEKAGSLPYGAQRRLEIARALATEPRLLLLDEPAAGMNPQETNELKDLVLQIRADRDLSILLIEHDMGMVMSLSDRIYVMEYGSRIAAGTPAEVRSNPRVIQAYLGESEDA